MKRIPNELWCEIKTLFSQKQTKVGRPEFDNKRTFEGVLYILKTGSQWGFLPEKYGCRTTVHGKFMKWCQSGVFEKMLVKAREYYRRRRGKSEWYALDTLVKKAPYAKYSGKNPTDRGKQGIKQSILVDQKGAPMYVEIAPANVHDSKLLEPHVKKLRKSKKLGLSQRIALLM